jgi:aminopeptidase-like protein
VVVGVQVMRELLARGPRRFTYRFLVVPETIGTVAHLSRHEELLPRLRAGLFLEMLGLRYPHGLQRSFAGDTAADRAFAQALAEHDDRGWTAGFGKVIGNDERQYNGPGVRVPMLSLTRVLPQGSDDWPYPEYHSSRDTLALVAPERLDDSVACVLRMLDTLEHDRTPVPRYKGEIFCSRFGIHIDWYSNPKANEALFEILYQVDGTRTVSEIAERCGVPFSAVRETVDLLRAHDLVTLE